METVQVTFADQYKAAGISPTADIIRFRQSAFETLRGALDRDKILDLTRLYFSLPVLNGAIWFRNGFASSDPSFSMVDNAREAGVLAYILLSAALDDGKVLAGLAPLTAAVGNARTPPVYPAFLTEAREKLANRAVELRRRDLTASTRISVPPTKEPPAIENDWDKTTEAIKAVNTGSAATLAAVGKQVQTAISTLTSELTDLREEADMLWWYVGGWSRCFDRPLADFEPSLIAVLAGLDLGRLVRTTLGPVSVPAILHKIIHASAKKLPSKVTIQDAVDALPQNDILRLQIGEVLKTCPDCCPVLTAFAKAAEIGKSPDWHAAYRKLTHIEETTSFKPVELAVQVFRETLMTKIVA